MKKIIGLAVLTIGSLVGGIQSAQAACSTTSTNGSFGTATSFAVNTTESNTSGSVTVTCAALSIGLLTQDSITLSLVSSTAVNGTNAAMTAGGTDTIPVTVCAAVPTATTCASPLPLNGASVTFGGASLINLSLTQKQFTLPIYIQTVIGSNVAAGTYTTTLGIKTNYSICTTLVCLGTSGNTNGQPIVPVTVTLIVTNDCTTITAPPVSFGTQPLLSSFASVSNQAINVTCTKGSIYTVSLDNGQHAVSNVRYMSDGTYSIAYDIYQGATSTRWGSLTAGQSWSSTTSTGISSDLLTRNFAYTAKILPDQTTPQAGTYTDTIMVSLSF
ncbi:spore coat protein U domain-containing protein [Yersinia nurmii]|uniref:Spore coat U domain-containing protein n=1 Tax=Yersinia nurmii TaxID=685706 RepID=A0AAW7JW73_9GAMM|nr:spore coat protein U domain-containing protein [Yersinia nurmii]MDN0086899.1 spore coat protein U domain-containing protein [Yersinia nurmii]CNE29141.1 spore coat U domain-containing protein [Yersinia nurmii]